MKKILLFMVPVLLLASCNVEREKYTNYQIGTKTIIPAEDRDKAIQMTENLVQKTNFHMTGGDYEDPEDVIREAQRTAEELYGKDTVGLYMDVDNDGHFYDDKFIPISDFTDKEKIIYAYLNHRIEEQTNSLN